MKKRINITIDEKTLYIVDKLAEERGIDRSTMMTLCIREKDLSSHYPIANDYDFNQSEIDYYKANALDPEQGWIE